MTYGELLQAPAADLLKLFADLNAEQAREAEQVLRYGEACDARLREAADIRQELLRRGFQIPLDLTEVTVRVQVFT